MIFETTTIRKCLSEDPIRVVDVGVAGGVMEMLKPAGTEGLFTYHGFEPNPDNYDRLPKAKSTNYHQLAISNVTGKLPFHRHSTVGSLEPRPDRERLFENEFETTEVDVETLENLRRNGTLQGLDIVKSDAERHDEQVLKGMGSYSDEPLCVVAEFHYYALLPGGFADIDRFLTNNGMILFSLSHKRGPLGELAGGDLMYLRDVGCLLGDGADKKRMLKLIAIACMLNLGDYAFVVISEAKRVGILSEEESTELSEAVSARISLPRAMPFRVLRLAHIASLASLVFSGNKVGAKSAPSSNRLVDSRRLYVRSRYLPPGWRRRYERHLRAQFEKYTKLRGLFYVQGDGAVDD